MMLVYFIIGNIGATSRLSRYYNHLYIEDVCMCNWRSILWQGIIDFCWL